MIFERRLLCRKCQNYTGNPGTHYSTFWCMSRHLELSIGKLSEARLEDPNFVIPANCPFTVEHLLLQEQADQEMQEQADEYERQNPS